jgi:hypothetical protein
MVAVDTPEIRKDANAASWKTVGMPDTKVITLVGVDSADEAKVQPVLSRLNNQLKTNGFNDDMSDNQQVFKFRIERNLDETINMERTRSNMYAAIDGLYGNVISKQKDPSKVILATFAPQSQKSEVENDDKLRSICKGRNVLVIPDSYSDCALNPKVKKAKESGQEIDTYVDIETRVIIARLFAWCKIAQDKESFDMLKAHLEKVSANKDLAGSGDLNELLKKLNESALSIRPVDYKGITDWQRSQEATGISA